jgi:hypothetical protein
MSEVWDQARIEQYITEGIEESLTLDYKAAGSLDKHPEKKKEITKDVSAMANSVGGIIIYGVAEGNSKKSKHLPEKITPVDRTAFSKEWLEHIIGNIQPRIDGVIIHSISINTAPNHVVYVVEIPQSHTAHQAKDCRYYRRYNFESVMMTDYEIRDVMGRQQHARIELEFKILIRTEIEREMFPIPDIYGRTKEPRKFTVIKLKVKMRNTGKVYAQYIDAFIEMPCDLNYGYDAEYREMLGKPKRDIDLNRYCTYSRDNTVRDIIKGGGGLLGPTEYGPARYVPILPGITMKVDDFTLTKGFEAIDWEGCKVKWTTHTDNAPPHSGEIDIKDIEIVDRRNIASDEFDFDDDEGLDE